MKSDGGHGGNVYAASRELGISIARMVDFSASINPLGPSPLALRAIKDGLASLQHYPDPDCQALRSALAERWELSPDRFVIGNGSVELIHVLPRALKFRHVLVLGPTFSEYARAVKLAGGAVEMVMARHSDGYRPPLDEALRRICAKDTRIDAIVFGHPNSPTGQACPVTEVLRLVRAAEKRSVWVIVDEAFVEYCPDRSLLRYVPGHPRVVVLRSFTKFYALPGLRVGYAVGSKLVIETIRRHLPPWTVNTLAQHAAVASLADRRHERQSSTFMDRERARFIARLGSIPGITVYPSAANFLLVELPPERRASAIVAALRKDGLLIRDCSTVPGLTERTVRIAVRIAEDNARLASFLSSLLKG
ncbi:MAG TPA: threonine-phosphate decarboxylase CobD [Nitrospiraceae bacterium]|jgi:threonine-phosphate decarboxylase|nr:threonine-phosphate decarboxylase CobD [Nitrospiraceae bacterium]